MVDVSDNTEVAYALLVNHNVFNSLSCKVRRGKQSQGRRVVFHGNFPPPNQIRSKERDLGEGEIGAHPEKPNKNRLNTEKAATSGNGLFLGISGFVKPDPCIMHYFSDHNRCQDPPASTATYLYALSAKFIDRSEHCSFNLRMRASHLVEIAIEIAIEIEADCAIVIAIVG